jgi:hypothetical protein
MLRLIPVLAALAIFATATSLRADGPPPRWSAPVARPMPPYSKQAQIGAYGRAVYPKYYRSFHFREFENIGIPSGDIGIHGNGLTRTPW